MELLNYLKRYVLVVLGLLIMTSLFSSFVFAIDCQYTKEIVESIEIKFLPFYEGEQLKELIIQLNENWNQPAKIINPNNIEIEILLKINANVRSKYACSSPPLDFIITKNLTVPANDFIELPVENPLSYFFHCNEARWTEPYEIQYQDTEFVDVRLVEINHTKTVCDGKDDGVACNSPDECGGGHCIKGLCSNSDVCFNNDCKCKSDEIQCDDNKRCVKKAVVPEDVKPECNKSQECVTGYINLETGLCAKSPAQLQTEKNQTLTGIVLCILLGGITILYLRNKLEKERQKTIQKEIEKIELENKKIQTKEDELNELKNQMKEIEKQEEKEKKKIKELEELKEKRNQLIKDNEELYKKPFGDPQANNRLVVTNPYLGGYRCFYHKGLPLKNYPISSLVHLWVWEKHHGRRPRPGYEIHHIDGKKENNDPSNLEEIEEKEHRRMHRTK